jgi:Na+/H+ antiporter NhaD/arsenite permease-like protein
LGSTFLLSPLLTNDITLLIVVPLTLQFGKILGNKLAPLVFLEAITANLGSGISPIGNPQNLYLYLNGGFGFWEFIKIMVLAMGIPMVGVLGIGWIVLGGGEGERVALSKGKEGVNRPLLLLSLVGIGGVIVGMELKMEWGIWIGVPFYLTLFPFLIKKVDWGILLLFLFIFLDCALLLQLPSLRFWIEGWGTSSTQLYWGTLFLSQLISNFPATILISSLHPSTPLPILYGADIGGNGTLISSLANLIALRYLGGGKNYLKFHLYSLPFLGVSGLWGVYLLGGI